MSISKHELGLMLQEDELRNAVLVVLANKQDMEVIESGPHSFIHANYAHLYN